MTIEHFEAMHQRGDGPYLLGRHVLHDRRSRDFDARMLVVPQPLKSVLHESMDHPWDQGEIGQCTAEAAYGLLMTAPFYRSGLNFSGTGPESDTLKLYSLETSLDESQIPGRWPPRDTGSTGLWSMKALMRKGFISSYHHAFDLDTVLQLLMQGPVSVGVSWYGSMFYPDKRGLITFDTKKDARAGGHQVCLVGLDVENQEVVIRNSWGVDWGKDGYGRLKFQKLGELLADHGDAVVPVIQ